MIMYEIKYVRHDGSEGKWSCTAVDVRHAINIALAQCSDAKRITAAYQSDVYKGE